MEDEDAVIYTINTMAVDGLVTQVTRPSAAIVLT